MAEQFMLQHEKCLKIISNFKFRKINWRLSSGEVKWRCTVKTCRAFLKTVEDDDRITEQSLNHNHESMSDQNYQKQFVTGVVKRKVTEDICTKPNKIFCNGIKNIATEHLQVSDVRNIKRNIYNAKRKILPPFPKSIEEIQLILDELNTAFLTHK
ncbi:RT RNaseH 2 domain-containing protein [Aphis craccivora]|uniref:RT RNaseH 2 domain-containing protein n=1 Tax=Aphis craccivora TaxID=307492 RepID=A0A6G0VXX4_APHCR|nr:RT RNaseH 2 domain-containing protein [Aphis craccivora]